MNAGLDPALEKAIEEFTKKKRERENKVKDLEVNRFYLLISC